ncbi:MAG: hypothetical protein A2139_04915 [Desulfobacca sp. RBG_16_60_12]|nr:MAG: hypothetical protein A2139_04915 [Desulfobacca sp. RBG_16_60_12]
MKALPLTEELTTTLQFVSRLELQHRDSEHYQVALERLDYLQTQLRSLRRLVLLQKRTSVVLRRVFRDREGERQWEVTRREWIVALPRQMVAPGKALTQADGNLLFLVDFLSATKAAVRLRNAALASRLEEHLFAAGRELQLGARFQKRRMLHIMVISYQELLAATDRFQPPKTLAELAAQISELNPPL